MCMIMTKRLEIIINELKKHKNLSNKYLIDLLNISEATLRRDLNTLEKNNLITRVHGGAVLTELIKEELSFDKNSISNIDSKIKIAKKTISYLDGAKYIYIDAGTTTNILIDYINTKNITVVTNGTMHLNKLISKKINTYFLGGEIKPLTLSSIGEIAISNLKKFNFDLALIGTNGIDENVGFTTHDIREASIKSLAISLSKNAFILGDTSKYGKIYFSKFADFNNISLITEES